jgi:hypothetical protein
VIALSLVSRYDKWYRYLYLAASWLDWSSLLFVSICYCRQTRLSAAIAIASNWVHSPTASESLYANIDIQYIDLGNPIFSIRFIV